MTQSMQAELCQILQIFGIKSEDLETVISEIDDVYARRRKSAKFAEQRAQIYQNLKQEEFDNTYHI